jgi:hypothetical protein
MNTIAMKASYRLEDWWDLNPFFLTSKAAEITPGSLFNYRVRREKKSAHNLLA